MAQSVIVDASFVIALLRPRDRHHSWAVDRSHEYGRPWHTCEAVISEIFFLLGPLARPTLSQMLSRERLVISFELSRDLDSVLSLLEKYADVPMSIADACLVRMSEILPRPVVLTTDSDFRVYRRHGRKTIPYVLPVEEP
jgi:predicted nucleic acid-binding protein